MPRSAKSNAGPASAEGISFGSRNKTYTIGDLVGSGACATVHAVVEAPDYVVKVAALPTKKTRKGDSPAETNARLLDHETVLSRVQFIRLQGTVIPRLPSSKIIAVPCGDVEGFRYLMMERMERPLEDVVRIMRQQKTSIHFGLLAVGMLECIQAIHEEKHVVVDIKTENFMFAQVSSGGRQKTDSMADLASRVRILDLALALPYKQITSHRADDGSGSENGTPLYRSIFMHQGSTPSRRDDLESLAYVIAELLIGYNLSKASKHILPWSTGQSDEEIGRIKEEQINDKKSELYRSIGDKSVAKAFSKYLDEVRNYSFKQKPDYESLSKSLLGIKIAASAAKDPPSSARRSTRTPSTPPSPPQAKKSATGTKPAPLLTETKASKRTVEKIATPRRRITRSQLAEKIASEMVAFEIVESDEEVIIVDDDDSSVCVPSPAKSRKRDSFESFDTAEYDRFEEAQGMDRTVYTDAQQTYYTSAAENPNIGVGRVGNEDDCAIPMELEITHDENDEPTFEDAVSEMNVDSIDTKLKAQKGLRLKYVDGPQAEDIVLIKGKMGKVSVGSQPSTSKGYKQLLLMNDSSMTKNHAKLDLDTRRRVSVVHVIRHKSGGSVQVRDNHLSAGSQAQAFVGNVIILGQTKFKVANL